MSGERGGGRWDRRQRAREAALRMLYEMEVGRLSPRDAALLHPLVGDDEAIAFDDDESEQFAVRLAQGAWEHREGLDTIIADATTNWRVERLSVLDRIVLRLAVREWLAEPATPPRVVLDEAIDLARRYSGDQAARFVNGVLDGAFRRLRDEGRIVD
jgi:N utilization substance protein B